MNITYRFKFPDGQEEVFELRLDPKTLAYVPEEGGAPPEWTRLGNNKCENCPLSEKENPVCPVARNLSGVIPRFVNHISYEKVDVSVETDVREFRKSIPLQAGISAIFGLVMVASGCPVLDKLRPMVFTHLPFAEIDETSYRALSMYLLAQYFRSQKGLEADWELKGLANIYEEISKVNRAFTHRLRSMPMKDANLNAVVRLDCFGAMLNASLVDRSIPEIERLFHAYL